MEEIRNAMRNSLDKARYEHTLGVAYVAACLATLYEADPAKALRAGMLHDCAKCLDSDELFRLCQKYNISISDVEKRNPKALLHAKVGAKLASDVYGEKNENVLDAIEYHTTGRPGMSILEKIIFVADYIEPGRNKAQDLQEIRKLAFRDIDMCVVKILQNTLAYLESQDGEIDPATKKTLEYYSK